MEDKRIAVLIDADNVSEKYIKAIFDEIANHGTPTISAYMATGQNRSSPVEERAAQLFHHAHPVVQLHDRQNATDSALIIDAMDILYSGNVDGFCIVSSDSDFTRLAARLRESGMYVIGMGEKKTPTPFIAACEIFKYLEVLAAPAPQTDKEEETPVNGNAKPAQPAKEGMASREEIIEALKVIITESSDEDGWAYLGQVGKLLNKRYPDFDTRNYGFSKLTPFVSSLKQFEIQTRRTGSPHGSHKYVRIKQTKQKSGSGGKGKGQRI